MRKIIVVSLLLFTVSGFSQEYKEMMQDNSINFYQVCKEADTYFKTHDKGKGSGWKGYQRWRNENESKYAPSGVRNDHDPLFVSKSYKNILKENSSSKSLYCKTNGVLICTFQS